MTASKANPPIVLPQIKAQFESTWGIWVVVVGGVKVEVETVVVDTSTQSLYWVQGASSDKMQKKIVFEFSTSMIFI